MIKKYKGFTLIELLVVIAIIGILASIVLVSLTTARSRAYDAEIKAELSQVRADAEMEFIDADSYSAYSMPVTLTPPTCATETLGYNFVPSTPNGQNYVAWCRMCGDDDKAWCVDSKGASNEVADVGGTSFTGNTFCDGLTALAD